MPGLDPAGVPKGLEGTAIPFAFNDIDSLRDTIKGKEKNPETITMHHNRLCKLYFGTILKFLKAKTQKDQDFIRNLRETLPQSFENLLNQTNTANSGFVQH